MVVGPPEEISRTYRFAMWVLGPVIRRWGRLEVEGTELLAVNGPLLIAANHDSYWDPVAIGVAGMPHRQIRALAKSTLWKFPGLGPILNGMGQIPIDRGAGDKEAMNRANELLRSGACIGVFLEGTTTRGRTLRARSGLGRLAVAVPEARILACTVEGTADLARFPKRPGIRVRFFAPGSGGLAERDDPAELCVRLLAEIREKAPITISGRRRTVAKRRRALDAAQSQPSG